MSGSEFNPPKGLVFDEHIAVTWPLFKQKLQIFLTASKKEEEKDEVKIAILLNCIGEEGLDVYNLLPLTDVEKTKFSEVVQAFDRYIEPHKSIMVHRYSFYTRVQGEDETFTSFFTDLKKSAKLCQFKEEESLLRDRIVMGTNDKALQERLLRSGDIPLTDAVKLCRASELGKQQMNVMSNKYQVEVIAKKPTKNQQDQVNNKKFDCGRCGTSHCSRQCPAFGKTCSFCKGKNHFVVGCWKKNRRSRNVNEVEMNESIEELCIGEVSESSGKVWTRELEIQGKKLLFKIDTGAMCNILSISTLKRKKIKFMLKQTCQKLVAFGNKCKPILPLGTVNLNCGPNQEKIQFFVVEFQCMPLLGLTTLEKLNIVKLVNELSKSTLNKEQFLENYKDNFVGIGKLPGKCRLVLKDTATPVVNPNRRVPESVKPRLKSTLAELVKKEIISPVEVPTDYVNNIVIVEKPDKSIRICLDPTQLNKDLKSNKYPIPTVADLQSVLSGKKFFTVLDMKDGFYAVELEEESSLLTTFITCFGKYKFNRLPFGITIAPEYFQQIGQKLFGDIKNLGIYFDDFIIAADTEKEHDETLGEIMKRAAQFNVKFNSKKLQFKVPRVKFVGFIFSEEGVEPDPEYLSAIDKLEEPRNIKELQRILGTANFLAKFIPKMSEITAPMRELLKKNNEFQWTKTCSNALNALKNKIKQAPLLKLFDPNLPIEIFSDASDKALGGCMFQGGKPVAFVSRSLNNAESRFPIIEKEMAALVFVMEKLHEFVYGRHVTVFVDHKPLVNIVLKDIHKVTNRLQRFRLKLLRYDVEVKYLPGKDNVVADLMSRSVRPMIEMTNANSDEYIVVHELRDLIPMTDLKRNCFKEALANDKTLKDVMTFVHEGWPNNLKSLSEEVKHFHKIKDDILIEDGLLFFGTRLIVPNSLKNEMLSLIHESHLGVNKCLNRARKIMYWKNMSSEITELVLSCKICERFRHNNAKEPLLPHARPSRPWEVVASDILSFGGKHFLVVVDAYSNWIELKQMQNLTAQDVINELKILFAQFGIPSKFFSDNMPYNSTKFRLFAKEWNFDVVTSSPHHAQSNGLAEKAVSICKNLLRRSAQSHNDINFFLMEYRAFPLNNINLSPAQLFLSRNLKTKLPISEQLLQPEIIMNMAPKFKSEQTKQKHYFDKTTKELKELSDNQNVLIKKENTWYPGKVVTKHGAPRSYFVRDEEGKLFRRNRKYLRPSMNSPERKNNDTGIENVHEQSHSNKSHNQEEQESTGTALTPEIRTRAGRLVQRPRALDDFVS